MAKRRLRKGPKGGFRTGSKTMTGRTIPSQVKITGPFNGKVQACVYVGKKPRTRRTSSTITIDSPTSRACGSGSNPRKALAAALRKLAGNVSKRSGALAGLK